MAYTNICLYIVILVNGSSNIIYFIYDTNMILSECNEMKNCEKCISKICVLAQPGYISLRM